LEEALDLSSDRMLDGMNETYLLTAWSRVLLEKLTGPHLVKKFLTFCGSRRFITEFAIARHLSLS